MKYQFVIKENNKSVIIFFTGWSTTASLYKDFKTNCSDLLVIYNYNNLILESKIIDLISCYNDVYIIGWSLGVWAASCFFSNLNINIKRSIAINGTKFPIDDKRGINKQIYLNTIENLSEKNLRKFQMRMCNSKSSFEELLNMDLASDIDSLKNELIFIKNSIEKDLYNNCFHWSKVYIGTQDRIFLYKNQQNAWNDTEQVLIDNAHYDLNLFQKIILYEFGN